MTESILQLEPNERILIQVRKHWFLLVVQLFGICIGAIVPLIFLMSYGMMSPELSALPFTLDINIFTACYAAWLILLWMAAFHIWTDYYLDVWTITILRIIAIDQRGFFSRKMASFRLDRLQDVIVQVEGIIPTLLDFGKLEAQTAGEQGNFKAYGLPHPGELKSIIVNATDQLTKTTN